MATKQHKQLAQHIIIMLLLYADVLYCGLLFKRQDHKRFVYLSLE